MKKGWIIALCVTVGVIFIATAVVIACVLLDLRVDTGDDTDDDTEETVSVSSRKFANDDLKFCTVSTGGGMLGGYRSVTLRRSGDGATLTVAEKETHENRERTTVYTVDAEALNDVKALVLAHNLYGASKRRYSDDQVLDGDTTSLSFTFTTGSFGVSENQVLSSDMRKGFDAVVVYLNSLAVGEGTVSIEPQRAFLYLRSGYTLQFVIEDAFDGKLVGILSEERDVSAYADCGIVIAADADPDCADATPVQNGETCAIVYDPQEGLIILLYADCAFGHDVFVLARLDGYPDSAAPLIAEMEGAYRMYLNE